MRKIFFLLVVILLAGCQPEIANRHSHGTTIICFGDSLTSGYGADEGADYPSQLRRLVNLPVINAGVVGDTTATALARLEQDVLSQRPKIVIITLGGNDFLQQLPKSQTLSNMEKIIDQIQARGSMVVWATVKTGLLGDRYVKDFAVLARRKHIVLIPDILKDIMFDVRYKYDQIHPNSGGYKIMAQKIHRTIKPLLED